MNGQIHLALALAAAGAAAAVLAFALVRQAAGFRQRQQAAASGLSGLRVLLAAFVPFVQRHRGRDVSLDRTLAKYERLVMQSGGAFLDGATAEEVFAARFVLPVLALAVLCALGAVLRLSPALTILVAIAFAALFYLWPEQALADLAKKRLHAFSRDLPQVLDVMRLVSQSGGDLYGAIEAAVEVSPKGPVRDELSRALGEVAIGSSLAAALNNVAARVDSPDANAVFSTMAQALEMGTGVSENLGEAVALMRKASRIRAQEKAQNAVVAMTFPLLLLILPGVFIVLFAPLVIQYATR